MKKIKMYFKGNVVRTFEIDKINIIPTIQGTGPSFFEFRKTSDNKYLLMSTGDVLPDVEFFEKMEIVEEE